MKTENDVRDELQKILEMAFNNEITLQELKYKFLAWETEMVRAVMYGVKTNSENTITNFRVSSAIKLALFLCDRVHTLEEHRNKND